MDDSPTNQPLRTPDVVALERLAEEVEALGIEILSGLEGTIRDDWTAERCWAEYRHVAGRFAGLQYAIDLIREQQGMRAQAAKEAIR